MNIIRIFAFVLCWLACLPALANHVTLSAKWAGDEPVMSPIGGNCNGAGDLGYRQFNAIQVSKSGEYHLADASDSLPGDVMVAIYSGGVDASNLVGKFDQGGRVNLQSEQDYIVVVQHWCTNVSEAVFAVSLSGEGEITGADVVNLPNWANGYLNASHPTADFSGVNRRYAVTDAQEFSNTGLYHFSDVSLFDKLDTEIRVYEGWFDPANTGERLVTSLDDAGGISLRAGTDYQFVITARTPGNSGAWSWVVFPPGTEGLNAGLNGAWIDPTTFGQGFLLDVMPEAQQVFLAWFTYDLERPVGGNGPMIGDDGHRWLTASGKYKAGANSVTLDIENTTGGVFDSAEPPVDQDRVYGTIELSFTDCMNGNLAYEIPAGSVSNTIAISRATSDHLPLCANLGSSGQAVITKEDL